MTVTVSESHRVLAPPTGPWSLEGTCTNSGVDSNIFFPEGYSDVESTYKAIMVCGVCPVQEECLEYACTYPSVEGVWGGVTRSNRVKYKRNIEVLRRIFKRNLEKAYRFYDRRENRETLSGIYEQIFYLNRGKHIGS
jgi:hypothetical protein